ncbi:LysR family transcriptional regulator [Mesorhizobium helmanticense]|uniref:LysR family transcriptional regulator n=2 Tax=Mesorhizobium helmanticense TaxID=1776423 RepID=A0A2T4IZ81_9HYPH|nr:LysR family transcriptional regulator [Mesorhizobium helmanticense]
MDRLQSMAIFVRAVERGSFSAAAEDFRLTGTMVGMHVRSLEERLGARLLNRTTRRQSLTDVGKLYYERCKQILGDVADAESSAARLQSVPRGRLRVMTPVSFGVHALAPACADYLSSNPEVAIDLVLSDRPIDMVEEGFEIMVRIGDLADSTMIARPLLPYRSIVCAAPAYLDRRGVPQRPDDLSGHVCMGFAHPVASREWRLQGPQGEISVPVSLALTVNNGEALRMAALSGLGIIMQPEILLDDDVRAGRLIPLLPDFLPLPKPMHVLTLPDRHPPPKIRSFVDFVVSRYGRR